MRYELWNKSWESAKIQWAWNTNKLDKEKKLKDAKRGLMPFNTKPIARDGVPMEFDPDYPPTIRECAQYIGASWDSMWMEAVSETAILINHEDFEPAGDIVQLSQERRARLTDHAMMKVFGRLEMTLSSVGEAPDEFTTFFQNPPPRDEEALCSTCYGHDVRQRGCRAHATAYVHCGAHLYKHLFH